MDRWELFPYSEIYSAHQRSEIYSAHQRWGLQPGPTFLTATNFLIFYPPKCSITFLETKKLSYVDQVLKEKYNVIDFFLIYEF